MVVVSFANSSKYLFLVVMCEKSLVNILFDIVKSLCRITIVKSGALKFSGISNWDDSYIYYIIKEIIQSLCKSMLFA